MRNAETVLGVLRERGQRHWPLERVYRLLFNPELYLLFVDRTSGRHAGFLARRKRQAGMLFS